MERLKNRVRRFIVPMQRIERLEAEVQECRKLNLRLAELCDVMMELVLPAATRDEARIAEVLERYRHDLGDPTA